MQKESKDIVKRHFRPIVFLNITIYN